MQISGYTGNGLSPFIASYGSSTGFGGLRSTSAQPQQTDKSGISQTFAQDIVRRLQSHGTPAESANPEAGAQVVTEQPKDTTGLEQSLARTVDFLRSNFGDAAAQAGMGLIYKAVGNGEVNEDTLGQGLLETLRFIDRNFGFAAGDQVMAFFNQDLNRAMNEHFDNGLMETFYAVTPSSPAPQGNAMQHSMAKLRDSLGDQVVQSLLESLEQSLAQGLPPGQALRQAAGQTAEQLAETLGTSSDKLAAQLGRNLAPLLHGAQAPILGGQLDLRV